MIVAVTGGTGFIGKKLIHRLFEQGDEVRVLSRTDDINSFDGVKYYKGDLREQASLTGFLDGVDILYHCAGQLTNEAAMRSLHVAGTQNLIDAAAGKIKHWVQLSSVGVYGPVSEGTITEESPLNPVGEYEITKAESDDIVLTAAKQGGFSCTILRPSNVFGVDMSNQSLFAMISMIDRGLFFFVGREGASANYIHVDNVVEGLFVCGSMPEAKGRIYNLSDHCSMEDMVNIIAIALNRQSPKFYLPELPVRWVAGLMGRVPQFPLNLARVDALTNRSVYSIERIQSELAYVHKTTMQDGMQQLVSAYRCR